MAARWQGPSKVPQEAVYALNQCLIYGVVSPIARVHGSRDRSHSRIQVFLEFYVFSLNYGTIFPIPDFIQFYILLYAVFYCLLVVSCMYSLLSQKECSG